MRDKAVLKEKTDVVKVKQRSGKPTHRWGTVSLQALNAYLARQYIWNPQEYPWKKKQHRTHRN